MLAAYAGAPTLVFLVPIPPSVNNLFVNFTGQIKGGRRRSPAYKQWAHEAGWRIKAQGAFRMFPGAVAVLIEAPLARNRDLDNALKPLLDLLVKMLVIVDDNLVDDLRIVRAGTGDDVKISIWSLT